MEQDFNPLGSYRDAASAITNMAQIRSAEESAKTRQLLEEQVRLQREALELEKKKLAQEQEKIKLEREQLRAQLDRQREEYHSKREQSFHSPSMQAPSALSGKSYVDSSGKWKYEPGAWDACMAAFDEIAAEPDQRKKQRMLDIYERKFGKADSIEKGQMGIRGY